MTMSKQDTSHSIEMQQQASEASYSLEHAHNAHFNWQTSQSEMQAKMY